MKMPVVFISDFGPMPAVEESDYTQALGQLGKTLPRPKAIVIMSGHWEANGSLQVTGSSRPETIYDYAGFPKEYYDVRYNCPGDPELAKDIAARLTQSGFPTTVHPKRGLDHGAWAPLSRVFPQADIPVVQLTVPAGEDPEAIRKIGEALAPLREAGVLLVAAGALIHNLRLIHFRGQFDPPDVWAVDFDRWLQDAIARHDVESLLHYKEKAPNAKLAAPTPEHFDPFFFFLGASESERVEPAFHMIRYGNGLLTILVSRVVDR